MYGPGRTRSVRVRFCLVLWAASQIRHYTSVSAEKTARRRCPEAARAALAQRGAHWLFERRLEASNHLLRIDQHERVAAEAGHPYPREAEGD